MPNDSRSECVGKAAREPLAGHGAVAPSRTHLSRLSPPEINCSVPAAHDVASSSARSKTTMKLKLKKPNKGLTPACFCVALVSAFTVAVKSDSHPRPVARLWLSRLSSWPLLGWGIQRCQGIPCDFGPLALFCCLCKSFKLRFAWW